MPDQPSVESDISRWQLTDNTVEWCFPKRVSGRREPACGQQHRSVVTWKCKSSAFLQQAAFWVTVLITQKTNSNDLSEPGTEKSNLISDTGPSRVFSKRRGTRLSKSAGGKQRSPDTWSRASCSLRAWCPSGKHALECSRPLAQVCRLLQALVGRDIGRPHSHRELFTGRGAASLLPPQSLADTGSHLTASSSRCTFVPRAQGLQ